jgi:hypothetical protein
MAGLSDLVPIASSGLTGSWMVISLPPYYCANGKYANSNEGLMGNGWATTDQNTGNAYTTGFKFGWSSFYFKNTTSNLKDDSVNAIKSMDNGSYNGLRPDQYDVVGDPLAFGPYKLNLTPIPNNGLGDVLLITTGSDVLAGSGTGYGLTDTRQFNLLFYATSSASANDLVLALTGYSIGSYLESDRLKVIQSGYFLFVSLGFVGSSNYGWWPGVWKDGDPERIYGLMVS